MPRTIANCLLLLTGLAWGMGFVAQQSAMDHIGPMLFIALRFALAAAVVLPFAIYEARSKDPRPFNIREKLQVTLIGSVFFLGMAFQQVGLLGTTVTNAGMLTGLYVLLVPMLVLIVWREKQHPVVWPAAMASVIGIWLLGGGSLGGLTWGDGLVLLCALCWTCHVVLMGKAAQSIGRPVRIATTQFAVCGTLGLLGHLIGRLAGMEGEPPVGLSALEGAAAEILYAAIVAGGLAFTLQAIGQRYTTEADAAVLMSSESLFAALGGAFYLGERLDSMGYLGCSMIFTPIVVVSAVSAWDRKQVN